MMDIVFKKFVISLVTILLLGVGSCFSQGGPVGHKGHFAKTETMVFGDVTSNKLTRQHDGTNGLWSYFGSAKESHAAQTDFIYNADLLSEDGNQHINIASTVYPGMGITSDQDPVYQEFLLLAGQALRFSGFLIEWGYKGHSSDEALQSYMRINVHSQPEYPFFIGVNWCDHWLTSAMKNASKEELTEAFHANYQYLIDTVFSLGWEFAPYYQQKYPLIFLFGGGITSEILREVLSRPIKLPQNMTEKPIILGSYVKFGSTPEVWSEWKDLLNGTFGWAPYILKPTPPTMKQWDYYGTVQDMLEYHKNLSEFGAKCLSSSECLLWAGSVTPGFDNRGCAGWGRDLRFLPREDLTTRSRYSLDAQWEFYLTKNVTTEVIVLATVNDFPEETTFLPLANSAINDSSFIQSGTFNSRWRGLPFQVESPLLAVLWYKLYKEVEFNKLTPGVNVSILEENLELISRYLFRGDYAKADYVIKLCSFQLSVLKKSLATQNLNLSAPGVNVSLSHHPVMLKDAFLINQTHMLYFSAAEKVSQALHKGNYQGLLKFNYQVRNSSLNHLKVFSPTKRKKQTVSEFYIPKSAQHSHPGGTDYYQLRGNFAEVCDIVTNSTKQGAWQRAVVELYKQNQAWDHSGPYQSDLFFLTEGEYLVKNVTLSFQLITAKEANF